MSRLLAASRPATVPLVLLALSAIAMLIGGYGHARLLHRGYWEVDWVGPLFALNALSTMVVILALIQERTLLYVMGALGISAGSVVSILISHSTSFLGFAEEGYDGAAKLIVYAEVAAILLVVLAVVTGALRRPPARDVAGGRSVAA